MTHQPNNQLYIISYIMQQVKKQLMQKRFLNRPLQVCYSEFVVAGEPRSEYWIWLWRNLSISSLFFYC